MSLAACAEITRKGDPDRFLAAMAAPPAARAALFPLYAFNVEVARAPWASAEPMIAEMRLQFWRDTVAEIGAGKPARAHEVAGPLADVIGAANLPVAHLDALIAARCWDIGREPFADAAAFAAHIDATAGNLMWLSARALGAGAAQEAGARDAGYAQGLANWFCAVPQLEALGRVPLFDGRPAAVQALAAEALDRLARARGADFGAAIPALRAGWRAAGVLRRAARDPGRVAAGRLHSSEFRRRGSLIFRSLTGTW